MAILLLLIAFCFSLYGGWVFFEGYFVATSPNEQWAAAMSGLAFAIIPYVIAKCLADMVAIRQRHLTMEQQAQQSYLLNQQLQASQKSGNRRPNPPSENA